MIQVLFLSLITFFLLGVPIAFSIGLASAAAILYQGNIPIVIVVQKMFTATDSFPLMAIPFFILAGSLMEFGGISRRLVDFANSIVGRMSGGLAIVAIMASMFFGAISGSGAATVAAIGGIMIPSMVKRGYEKNFSTAVQSCAGTLGVIIPPSIPMVIYGVITGVSIGDLFMAGFIPGFLIGGSMMVMAYKISKKEGYKGDDKQSMSQIIASFKEAILALVMPVIILGGIYGGIFTPTEAAVVAVVYAFIIGTFVYKELKFKNLKDILTNSVVSTATVMIIIASASVFGWLLASQQVPQTVAKAMLSVSSNPLIVLLMINILLLFVGTFMETVAAIIILVPVFMPMITQLGIDPLHFGIIVVVNLAIGMVTPPLGVCLFVGCGIANLKLEDITRRVIPFIVIYIIDLLLITYVPAISTFLPAVLK